jgi:predicted glycogen debranching enzyme
MFGRGHELANIQMPKMCVDPRVLSDLEKALQLEWLVTNGLGGYASSTVLNINTRKYHGVLVAAFNPPVDRHVVLAKVDEEVQIGDEKYPLGSNEFKDVIYPDGYTRLRSFSQQPFPTFNYQASEFLLKKMLFMPQGSNTTIISYEAFNALPMQATIRLLPLVNMRHFHETTSKQNIQRQFNQELLGSGVKVRCPQTQEHLTLLSTDGVYTPSRNLWIERLYYRTDEQRGENCVDDNYQPGFFTLELGPKSEKTFFLAAIAGKDDDDGQSFASFSSLKAKELYSKEVTRKRKVLRQFYRHRTSVKQEDWLSWLVTAADSFIVNRKSVDKKSVIAGYHWFEDWGRDTLISLPGLTLVTRRFDDAENILLTFKEYCREGLVPNRFPDRSGDEPVYDSVDASLWFFNAVFQFLKYTGKHDFVQKELWETLQDMIQYHINGTQFGIHMDKDGLLAHGSRLTWMDVQVEGSPVTPRSGKAVEIQALWYNALRIMETLATRFGQTGDSQQYGLFAENAKASFNRIFWYPEGDYLFDCIGNEGEDASLRPNQIIAASLDFCMLDDMRRGKVVDAVWKNLWGTYGLRTLSNSDPKYIGEYHGGFVDRDRAYHNGTVWAWLLGPFVTAFLKTRNHEELWRRYAFEEFLKPLFHEETYKAGIGSLSEIFDGDPPHASKGCISQAWSVAEPLRAYIEDVLLERLPQEENLPTQ